MSALLSTYRRCNLKIDWQYSDPVRKVLDRYHQTSGYGHYGGLVIGTGVSTKTRGLDS